MLLQLNVTLKTSEWNNKGLPHAWLIKFDYLQKNLQKKMSVSIQQQKKSRCVDCHMEGEQHSLTYFDQTRGYLLNYCTYAVIWWMTHREMH